jgi:hypothetical protein
MKPMPEKPFRPKLVKKADKKAVQKKVNPQPSLFERINKFLDNHLNTIFWVSFCLTLLSALLLFDIRISLSGDDSAYIIRAADFIHHFTLPGFQGPLYPIVLSPFIGIFGINVVILKFVSLVIMLGFLWFIYKAFKNRIPSLLLSSMLFLISVNSFILYYASQTYSEALFMFLQALTFLVFFTYFIDREKETDNLRLKPHLILALCVLSLVLTRSVGLAAVFAIAGYFLFKGQWKNILGFVISFAFVVAVFEIIKYFVWKTTDIDFTVQIKSLTAKDYYNPSMGSEDLAGFIQRFFSNSNQYISNYLYTIIGLFKPEDAFSVYPAVTFLTYLILFASVILAFKKNSYLFFTGIYTLVFLVFTFLMVNTYWGQNRFIIPYIPMVFLVILSLFYYVFSLKQLSVFKGILPVIVVILFILAINTSVQVAAATRQVKNKYSGLTPDWENYCKISEWASANLPMDALVACRKPSISFIYSNGRSFFGITRVPAYSVDSCLINWQQKHLHYYLIPASSIRNNHVSKELFFAFKRSVIGYGVNNDELGTHNVKFYLMDFPDSIRTRTLNELDRLKIDAFSDFETLRGILNEPGSKISIIYPDSLIQMLAKAKVTHVLTANLRSYKTVERFMGYIEFKDPGIWTKIMQIGNDDNEPAYIYKLNYDSYGLN